jgi:hypothetical protein
LFAAILSDHVTRKAHGKQQYYLSNVAVEPAPSINTLTRWHGLRSMGIKDRIDIFGALMAEH